MAALYEQFDTQVSASTSPDLHVSVSQSYIHITKWQDHMEELWKLIFWFIFW